MFIKNLGKIKRTSNSHLSLCRASQDCFVVQNVVRFSFRLCGRMMSNWGNYPKKTNKNHRVVTWRNELALFDHLLVLPYGAGRSYGDSCLNEHGTLLYTYPLNHMIVFNPDTGILRCEAGITIKDILEVVMPKGWILAVMPGTQYVTIGGAIANDVHGKNHHRRGSFGCHLTQFELLRSDQTLHHCSRENNTDLFYATIGGLGLTGLILWAEIQLMPLSGAALDVSVTPFYHLEEYQALNAIFETTHEYTSAWLDSNTVGRGIYFAANSTNEKSESPPKSIKIPCYFPNATLNRYTIHGFNQLYFYQHTRRKKKIQSIQKALFPLDSIIQWNLLYGKRGFLQYQCVVPSIQTVEKLLSTVFMAGERPFLSVLKTFGDTVSGGLLSFPMPGITLAMDFPFRGKKTLTLLDTLDTIVMAVDGRLYPAKDARMSATAFSHYFPNTGLFKQYKDTGFSSSFWRRVMEGE